MCSRPDFLLLRARVSMSVGPICDIVVADGRCWPAWRIQSHGRHGICRAVINPLGWAAQAVLDHTLGEFGPPHQCCLRVLRQVCPAVHRVVVMRQNQWQRCHRKLLERRTASCCNSNSLKALRSCVVQSEYALLLTNDARGW